MTNHLNLERLLVAGRAADYPVALYKGEVVHFAAFARAVADWRNAFAGHTGQRWALYFKDSFNFSAALLGAWHAGRCVYLPADVQPTTLALLSHEVDGFAGDIPDGYPTLATADISALGEAHDWLPLDRDAELLVVYTSGSEGQPCALPKKLSQLFNEVNTLAAAQACCWNTWGEANLTVYSTVSHQHIYGLLFSVLWPLAAGRPFRAERLAYPEDMAVALSAGPAVLIASPAHLKRLPENLDWSGVQQQLRAVFSSGGLLPDSALPLCRNLLGQTPIEVYGSSETGGVAWRQRTAPDAISWQLFSGVAISLDGELNGETLRVRSPNLADDDWFTTADRARWVEGGFVLLGRQDRIVKIEEKRVSLSAMEQALHASGLVDQVRLVLLSGTMDGMVNRSRSTLGGVVVPSAAGWALYDTGGKHALNNALRRCLLNVVEASVLPRRWRYVWALPVNTQGKTTEAALLKHFDLRRPQARLLSQTEDRALLTIHVSPRVPYFNGHFPAIPLLPGVAQIEWAIQLGRELFTLPPDFIALEAVKFQQLIQPDSQLQLELVFAVERQALSFKLTSAIGTHAIGRILFKQAGGV